MVFEFAEERVGEEEVEVVNGLGRDRVMLVRRREA